MSYIDQARVERFKELYREDQSNALRVLYEWTKTGVVNRSTFVECMEWHL